MATRDLDPNPSHSGSSTASMSAESIASSISDISDESAGLNNLRSSAFKSAVDLSTEISSGRRHFGTDGAETATNQNGGQSQNGRNEQDSTPGGSSNRQQESTHRSQSPDLRSLLSEFSSKIEDTQRKIATEFKDELKQVKEAQLEALIPIKTSIEEAGKKIDALEQEHKLKINANTSKIIETNTKLQNAELQIKQLQQQINSNKPTSSHNSFNPAILGRMNNIVVSGIAEVQGEDLISKLKDIGNKLNCELSQFKARRLGKTRQQTNADQPAKPRAILVELSSHWEKRKFYAARTKLKNTDDYSRIFFNEDLDKNSSELFYKGRQAKKQAKIKSIWTYGCQVFFTKLGSEQPILLTSANQLPTVSLRNVSANIIDNSLSTTPSTGSLRASLATTEVPPPGVPATSADGSQNEALHS